MSHHPSYVELKLDRRVYKPGDLVTGVVTVVTTKPKRFDSIKVTLEGKTELEVSPKDVGLFDAFYAAPEPIYWIRRVAEVAKSGTFAPGRNTFDFELALAPTTQRDLIETLKGLCIRTTYIVNVAVNRGFGSRALATECELYVQVPTHNGVNRPSIPPSPPNQFKFSDILAGEVQSLSTVGAPLSGHVMLLPNSKGVVYSSVEIEILRVEDVFWGEEALREICPVITLQVIDGPLPSGTVVPFFLVVPRLLVSPSQICDEFQVSYFFNVLLTFAETGEVQTRTVPLTFIR